MRTCIGCRRVASAAQLVRVARDRDGVLRLSRDHPGRGAWLCARAGEVPETGCLEQAIRRQAFNRAFRAPVGEEAVSDLRQAVLRRTVRERARIERGAAAGRAAGRD